MFDDVTDTLKELIENRSDFGPAWVQVNSFDSATNLTGDKLHLCLYAVEEHPHTRNAPMLTTPQGYTPAPLGLVLHYVITFVGSHLESQKRLARVAQVFHSTPRIGPADLAAPLQPHVQQLAVRLNSPSIEERTSLWSAYGRDLRLALYYSVEVVPLPVLDAAVTGRIGEHRVEYGVMGR